MNKSCDVRRKGGWFVENGPVCNLLNRKKSVTPGLKGLGFLVGPQISEKPLVFAALGYKLTGKITISIEKLTKSGGFCGLTGDKPFKSVPHNRNNSFHVLELKPTKTATDTKLLTPS